MLEKTRGIVLKSHKYSETSLICKVFSDQFGVLSFMVPGIRSTKNKRGNILQTGQLLEIDLYYRENRNFQRFKEYKVAYIPINTFSDIKRSSVQSFMMELSIQLVKEGEVNSELFNYLYDSLISIDKHEMKGMFPIIKLLEISQILGFNPSNNFGEDRLYFSLSDGVFHTQHELGISLLDRQQSELVNQLLFGKSNFTSQQRKILLETLLLYFQHHIPNFKKLKSIEILSELVNLS